MSEHHRVKRGALSRGGEGGRAPGSRPNPGRSCMGSLFLLWRGGWPARTGLKRVGQLTAFGAGSWCSCSKVARGSGFWVVCCTWLPVYIYPRPLVSQILAEAQRPYCRRCAAGSSAPRGRGHGSRRRRCSLACMARPVGSHVAGT